MWAVAEDTVFGEVVEQSVLIGQCVLLSLPEAERREPLVTIVPNAAAGAAGAGDEPGVLLARSGREGPLAGTSAVVDALAQRPRRSAAPSLTAVLAPEVWN